MERRSNRTGIPYYMQRPTRYLLGATATSKPSAIGRFDIENCDPVCNKSVFQSWFQARRSKDEVDEETPRKVADDV